MFKVIFEDELQDAVFETEEEANDYGLYLVSCSNLGAEILNMSNPGDYPYDGDVDYKFEVIEVGDDQ